MFEFKVKAQRATLSFIEAEEPQSFGGPPRVQLQAVMTFDNGRSWVLPLPLLLQLVEPSDGDAEVFLDGLRKRFAPPKAVEQPLMPDYDITPKDDGGLSFRVKKPKD